MVYHHGRVCSDSTNLQSYWGFETAQVKNKEDFFLGEKRVVTSKKHDKKQSQYKNTFCYTENGVEV